MSNQGYIRTLPLEVVPKSDGLTLEGYSAVFNSPAQVQDWAGKYEEVIMPGAFDRTLKERMPKLLFEHGKHPLIGNLPIGIINDASPDSRGVHIRARLSDNWLIQPIRDAVRDGGISGMSFHFTTPKGGDKWEQSGKSLRRTVLDLDSREMGPVVFPAYEPTTASIRSMLDQLPDLTRPDTGRAGDGAERSDVTPGNGVLSPEQLATMRARDRALRFKGIINGQSIRR